jgi:hypothetical protein
MTITDNGRVEVDDETMTRGRQLATEGRMPSKRELQKHLRKGWDVVNAVYTKLGEEVERAAEERRSTRRAAMRRLASRKRSGVARRPSRQRFQTVNEPAVEQPREVAVEQAAVVIPEAVEQSPAPSEKPVNETPPLRRAATWPVVLLAMPAFVAIWSGWVDLGRLTGFGVVHPLPGIADEVALNTAITLPIGLETYAAYALYVWLSGAVPGRARLFARRSAVGALALGAGGQVAYHLMIAAGVARAPWWITTVVACLPVAVLGMGAALRHLVHAGEVSDE